MCATDCCRPQNLERYKKHKTEHRSGAMHSLFFTNTQKTRDKQTPVFDARNLVHILFAHIYTKHGIHNKRYVHSTQHQRTSAIHSPPPIPITPVTVPRPIRQRASIHRTYCTANCRSTNANACRRDTGRHSDNDTSVPCHRRCAVLRRPGAPDAPWEHHRCDRETVPHRRHVAVRHREVYSRLR